MEKKEENWSAWREDLLEGKKKKKPFSRNLKELGE